MNKILANAEDLDLLAETSDCLFFHTVLGRGYDTFEPLPSGLVFSVATPHAAVRKLQEAERGFIAWHKEQIRAEELTLLQRDGAPDGVRTLTPERSAELDAIKKQLAKIPNMTWKEDQVTKSTLVDIMSRSYYNSLTYIDTVGARLAGSLSVPARLAGDLSWTTLTAGTTDETLIRSNGKEGSLIYNLAGVDSRFNYFCRTQSETAESLVDRINTTVSGRVIQGHALIINEDPRGQDVVSASTLLSLAKQVYARGKDGETKIKIVCEAADVSAWNSFFAWDIDEITDGAELTSWQYDKLRKGPTSPHTCITFACQAVRFAEMARLASDDSETGGRIPLEVKYSRQHLEKAKRIARALYDSSSGIRKLKNRINNLLTSNAYFLSEDKLVTAKQALIECIEKVGKLPRKAAREIPGVTLGLLDELVRRGDIKELKGKEECQMGNTTKAYTLPDGVTAVAAMEAFHEAEEDAEAEPDSCDNTTLLSVYSGLQRKAEMMDNAEAIPVVPLSKMDSREIKILPFIVKRFVGSVLLRGVGREPEPPHILEDDPCPLDKDGLNLWLRYKPSGEEFRSDWNISARLGLSEAFNSVPENNNE